TVPLGLPAWLVGAAQGFLVTGLLVAVARVVAAGPDAPLDGAGRSLLAALLVAGWIGLTVAGSLLHLLTVLRRVRNLGRPLPAPHPRRDRALAAGAVGALALFALARVPGAEALAVPAIAAVLAAGLLVAARVLGLAARAVGPRR